MNEEPLHFNFPLDSFDLGKLPIDPAILKSNPGMLEAAVADWFAEMFRPIGGQANIAITKGVVTVAWIPGTDKDAVVNHAVERLRKGDYATAIPLLEGVARRDPDNAAVLYNLGMAYSDMGRVDEAIPFLERFTKAQPGNAQGWNALGVAYGLKGQLKQAEEALRWSIDLDPADGYGHRNLGSIIGKNAPEEAIKHFRKAVELMPKDSQSLYCLGLALFNAGEDREADEVLNRVLKVDSLSETAKLAEELLTKIAHKAMRTGKGTGPRVDVALYCLAAMQLFAKDPALCRRVTFEIAVLGRSGLDINNPAPKYKLKSMDGEFSGLQLVSYMYVGMKQIMPDSDAGIDLAEEYQHAKMLYDAGSKQ